jgi:hypothetical protein
VLRGYVSRFLVRNDPNPPDMDSWTPVLESALGLLSCPDWPKRLSEFRLAQTRVDLAFPLGRSQDLTKPIVGDLRAGAAILLHGNTWCRQVGDSFRLHGADPTHPATLLRWLAVHTLGACELHGTMQCPVEDSVPVSVVVTIRDDSEKVVGEWRSVIAPGDPDTLSINFSPAINRPVSIEMAAQASRPIESGERAVIDISPLALDPIDPSNARSETKAGDVARTGRVRALAQGAS